MNEDLRILIVEDRPIDAELLEHELARGGFRFLAKRVDTQEAFERALEKFKPNLILSDFSMPGFDGMSALNLAHAQLPDVPFIFVSGTIGEDRAIEALKSGATDYVLKDSPKRLVSAVSRALEEAKKRATLRSSQKALQASEERFRSFMQHMPARACIRDADGKFIFVNENWERAAGQKAQDMLGHTGDEFSASGSGRDAKLVHEEVIRTGRPVGRVLQTGADEEMRWWLSNHFPIPNADGTAAVGTVSIDITEQKAQRAKLDYLAYYDGLTGLPNRILFGERLSRCLHDPNHHKPQVAVMMWNIKRFPIVAESLGHHAADALLVELAARFRLSWPDQEDVARLTADSFAGMLTDVGDEAAIAHIIQKVSEKVFAPPLAIEGNELAISMTAGIAVYPADGEDVDTLLRNAQAALSQANASNARYLFYQPAMNASVCESLMLENRLKRAARKHQFELHYQPKLDLTSGRIVGLEALLRWNEPEYGVVMPGKFIPILEENGLIIEVGEWALRHALKDYCAWLDAGLHPPRIAVNVSPMQLSQKNFLDVIRSVVHGCDGGPHGLDLEITESVLMQDIEANIEKLRVVRELGFNIAIDDFGTGYSSLGYLAKLPINALKIDRSFVITMANEADGLAIASTIISLAHALRLNVIAEGVETEDQRRLLRLLKCEQAQGYLFHKPLPLEKITALLERAVK